MTQRRLSLFSLKFYAKCLFSRTSPVWNSLPFQSISIFKDLNISSSVSLISILLFSSLSLLMINKKYLWIVIHTCSVCYKYASFALKSREIVRNYSKKICEMERNELYERFWESSLTTTTNNQPRSKVYGKNWIQKHHEYLLEINRIEKLTEMAY